MRALDGGSNGFDTITIKQTAKNVLTVGAVHDLVAGYQGPTSVVPASFSSCGPTDDGRIKPDVVANGIDIYSCNNGSDTDYRSDWWGTSFSTPSVSGSLALLLQLQNNLHGTNQPLLASTLKALLIHTADEAGPADGPDYRLGWGLVNTFAAAELMTSNAAWNSKPHIVEQVCIAEPTNGIYTVLVTHKGALSNDCENVSILISGNVASDIDFSITEITCTTNEGASIIWNSAVGSIHAVMGKTNLLETNAWDTLSDEFSITKETRSWTDAFATNAAQEVQFYRIKQIK